MDCLVKLDKVMFNDSKLCQKLTLGRTKAETLAMQVLAPKSLSDTVNFIRDNQIFYGIQTDASNKKK